MNYQTVRGMGQAFVKMTLNQYVKAKINYAFASIAGNDIYAKNPGIYERGISMTGEISEISSSIDIRLYKKFNFYGIMGFGYTFYNPTMIQNGISSHLPGSNSQNKK